MLTKDDIQAHRDRLARNFAELTRRLHCVEGAIQFADLLLKQIAEAEAKAEEEAAQLDKEIDQELRLAEEAEEETADEWEKADEAGAA